MYLVFSIRHDIKDLSRMYTHTVTPYVSMGKLTHKPNEWNYSLEAMKKKFVHASREHMID